MNRAWIPAGALAGVSVAGLLALGPLTDSMGTPVSFPTTVATPKSTPADFVPVSVKLSRGTVGTTTTASFASQGGRTAPPVTNNSTEGTVGYRKTTVRTAPAVASVTRTTTRTAKPKAVVKKTVKTVKRQSSIGGPGETNSSAGLASGSSSGSRGVGEQQNTPSSGN
jgi:hypothetical protein